MTTTTTNNIIPLATQSHLGRAYLAPYGVGLGHASRIVMVADQLRRTCNPDLRFSSFGEAEKYVSLRGYKCASAPPVEFAWSTEGGFSVKHSLANIPKWFTNFSRQINHELRNISMYQPDVILSDSRLSPLLAAKLLDVPSIVLLNQVKLLLSPRLREFAISRFFESMVGELLGSMWNLADRVLVPDLPPPYTLSAHNVWGVGSVARKIEYIGFTAPRPSISEDQIAKVASSLQIDRKNPIVFVHISGPLETRLPAIKIALEASELADSRIQFIFSEGLPHGNPEPQKIKSGWYYQWCPVRDEVFALSDLVVMRGGHTALSQAINFGKPVVTIPIENHGEQLGNSEKVANLGAGVMIKSKGLRPDHIADAIQQVLANPTYTKKVLELKRLADSLDGINNVVKIVRSYF